MNKYIIHLVIIMALGLFSSKALADHIPVTLALDHRNIPDENITRILENKLSSALSETGIHSEGVSGLFLSATITPISGETVEGGLRKIKITKYELALRLEHPVLQHHFATTTLQLTGAGYDKTKSMMDAARSLNSASSKLSGFLVSSNEMALDYYRSNIDNIISTAMTLSNAKEYDAALTLLWAIPPGIGMPDKIDTALNEVYSRMQKDECMKLLNKARNAFLLKQYEEAVGWLDAIDPTSICAEEAQSLANKMGTEIRTAEKEALAREERRENREAQMYENERNRQTNLEKEKIRAISSVAQTYLQSQLRTVYYVL